MTYISPITINAPINVQNQRRQEALIDALFRDYSKLLVLRVDLYWKKEYADVISYENMNEAFTRLRNNMRYNSLFEHHITYCAKLEYGPKRGWHYHVLFFFYGQCVRNDYLLAQRVGEYWSKIITHGMGDYFSPNMNTGNYQTVAVGMIEYYESSRIADLKAAASYLVKETVLSDNVQMLDASGKVYRSYRQGQYSPSNSRAGRPRLHGS